MNLRVSELVHNPKVLRYAPWILLAIWGLATHPAWFFDLRPLTWGDWNFLRPETMQAWLTVPQAWNRENGLGVLDYQNIAYYPQLLVLGFLAKAGVPFAVSERILFMWPAALLPLLGAYDLARRLNGSRLGSVLAALVYGTNAYILIIQWQQLTIAVVYGLAPWVLSVYLRVLESRHPVDMVKTAMLLSLCFVFEPRIAFIVAGLVAAATIAHAVRRAVLLYRLSSGREVRVIGERNQADPDASTTGRPSAERRSVGRILLALARSLLTPFAVVAGLTAILCAYWIVPLLVSAGSAVPELITGQPFGNYLTLNYAFSLNHPFWDGAYPAFFRAQPPVPLFLVIPILAFSAVLLRRDPAIGAWALLALLGAFLTKQSSPPFPEFYNWLFFNLPGFELYREASKFFLVVSIAYVPLIAVTTTTLASRFPRLPPARKLVAAVLVAGLAAAVVLAAVPASNGQLGGLFAPVSVPNEYNQVSQVLLGNATGDTFYRTFWWPTFERFGAHTTRVPALSGIDAAQTYMHAFLENPRDFKGLFNNSETHAFLDLASVRFLVVPYDPLGEIYPYYGPQAFFVQQLKNLPWLQQLNLPGVQTAIFVNGQARPYVYGSSATIEGLQAGDPDQAVTMTTNVTFHVQDEGAVVELPLQSGTQTVILSERFDPGWQLTCTDGYRASAQSVFGLDAFPAPSPNSKTCTLGFGIQSLTVAAFAFSGTVSVIALGSTVIWHASRRFRSRMAAERGTP